MIDGDKFKIGAIVPGNIRKFTGLNLVNPLGMNIRNNIDLITFVISDFKINLSDIYYQVIDFIKALEEHIEKKAAYNPSFPNPLLSSL